MVSYHKESAGRYLSVVKTRKFNRICVATFMFHGCCVTVTLYNTDSMHAQIVCFSNTSSCDNIMC